MYLPKSLGDYYEAVVGFGLFGVSKFGDIEIPLYLQLLITGHER
jgi:hypothetical protein